ncbi:MAG: ABC transporter permease, partial [Chitinophagaceae bacterium]
FFSITVFPNWMQQLVQVLPLTQFNEAIRKISFEGAYLWDCWLQISVLLVWIFIVYALVKKYFKWE